MSSQGQDHASTGDLGRRARKKLATRDALRDAAVELMADRSFASVTVEEICERADVAPSTFFRHFPTKEDVVLADLADRVEDIIAAVDAIPLGVEPGEFVVMAAATWAASRLPAERLRAEAQLLIREPALQAYMTKFFSAWEAPLAERLANRFGYAATDLEPALGAACLLSTIRVVVRHWAQTGDGQVHDYATRAISAAAALFDDLFAEQVGRRAGQAQPPAYPTN
jgi:AcrR family transcriptional regulator